MIRTRFLLALSWWCLWMACKHPAPRSCQLAFYHWTTELQLPSLQDYLDSLQVRRIYFRVFDVDLDPTSGRPVPVGMVSPPAESLPAEWIPVVFITNRTLRSLTSSQIDSLAGNMVRLMRTYGQTPAEVQLDCDWTAQTRERFFRLVTSLRHAWQNIQPGEPPLISVTIRLHQYRYPERTGVPPADRGMLMVYNVGEIDNPETVNSILDLALVQEYMRTRQPYPLPLDIVLPLFQWGVVFRDGELVQLLYDLDETALLGAAHFERTGQGKFRVTAPALLQGFYLNEGDLIRLETIHSTQLDSLTSILAESLPSANRWVAWYHLDQPIIERFSAEQILEWTNTLCNQE